MGEFVPITSRRMMLGALAAGAAGAITSGNGSLIGLQRDYGVQPAVLCRTREGRHLRRVRYQNAEGFFAVLERGIHIRARDILYQSGIVAQLALSAHLLDVGFADTWCAKHIGLHVSKSLNCANASGFGHDCSDMERLAVVLSPYGRWRNPRLEGDVLYYGGFTPDMISPLLQRLLDQVKHVTGHPLPRVSETMRQPKSVAR